MKEALSRLDISNVEVAALVLFVCAFTIILYCVFHLSPGATDRFASIPLRDVDDEAPRYGKE